MKKVLLGLLAVILVLGVLGAAGFTGYRYGFNQGMLSASNGDAPRFIPGFGFGPQRMPMHNFGNGFNNRFDERGFNMMQRGGMQFGFFPPFMSLARLAFWGLIIWAVYTLLTRSGWRITRATPIIETPSTDSSVESKES